MEATIRQASEADLEAINEIYNHCIVDSHISFDAEPWDLARRRAWWKRYTGLALVFVQSGMEPVFDSGETELASPGRLCYEAIWLFYRTDIALALVGGLKGLEVAVGEAGSGTGAVGGRVLR